MLPSVACNRIKLEKLWNLRFPQLCCFTGWQVSFKLANHQNIPEDSIPKAPSSTHTFHIVTAFVYMFCIVTAVRVHVLYCDSSTCTCSVLWQQYVYMFCIVTAVRVHVLYCDSSTCDMFCIVTAVRKKKFEKHWSKTKSLLLHPYILKIYCDCSIRVGRSGSDIIHCIWLKPWFLFCNNLWKDTIINNYIHLRWFDRKPVACLRKFEVTTCSTQFTAVRWTTCALTL
jgi:hypothetical protein